MKKKISTIILIFPFVCGLAYAQSPALDYTFFKDTALSLQYNNSALLHTMETPLLGESKLGYFYEEGEFKHLYQGESKHGVQFSSERFEKLKDWVFYGAFDFKSFKEIAVDITSHAQPFRSNPYQVADSLKGDWHKQNYNLKLKVAAPKLVQDKLTLGMGLSYNVLTGARQKDPRPLNTSNELELAPSVLYELNKNHSIGLTGAYQFYREDLSVERINMNQNYNMYKLLGLGEYEASSPIIVSSNSIVRSYKGNKYGGELFYSYQHHNLNWKIGGSYHHYEEEVIDGTTFPKNAGLHSYHEYGIISSLAWKSQHTSQYILLKWNQRDFDNREFHQLQNSQTKQYETIYTSIFNTALKSDATLEYFFSKSRPNNLPTWWLKLGAGYDGFDNRYTIPQSFEIVDKINVSLSFDKQYELKKGDVLSFRIGSNYNFIIEDKISYTEKDFSTNFVANNIFYPIHGYNALESWNNDLNIQYNLKPFQKSGNQLFIRANGFINTAMQDNNWFNKGDTRQGFQLTIGLYN